MRALLAVCAALLAAPAVTAEPVRWGYSVSRVWTPSSAGPFFPTRLIASGEGLTADDIVILNGILDRPTFVERPLPDPADYWRPTYDWTQPYPSLVDAPREYEQSTTDAVEIVFRDAETGKGNWAGAAWSVRRRWLPNADRLGWTLIGEEDVHGPTAGDGDNYMVGNRYDVEATADGGVKLWMTPDVPDPNFVPEPATLLMAGVGLAAAGAARLRRARPASPPLRSGL